MQPRVVELLDVVDAVHEEREVLELRPLVVDDGDRRGDLDRLRDRARLRRHHAAGRRTAARKAATDALRRERGRAAAEAEHDQEVPPAMAPLLLDADPRAGEAVGDLAELAAKRCIRSEPARNGDRADLPACAAPGACPLPDRSRDLAPELLVLRKCDRELTAARAGVLELLRSAASEHSSPFVCFPFAYRDRGTPNNADTYCFR